MTRKPAPRLSVQPAWVGALVGAGIGVGVALVLLLARGTDAMTGLEWRLVDTRTKTFAGARPPHPDLVLAEVGNEDVAAIRATGSAGNWPWPLDLTAYAFAWMKEAGVRAVAVDIYQFDRGRVAEELGLSTAEEVEAYERDHGGIEPVRELAAAYRGDTRVVLAMELSRQPPEGGETAYRLRRPVFLRQLEALPPLDVPTSIVRPYVNLPVLRLLEAARGAGFAVAVTDDDGVLRRAGLVGAWDGRRVPSLPLATLLAARDDVRVSGRAVAVGDRVQRLSDDGTFLLAFRGEPGTFPRISPAAMVAAGAELADRRARGEPGIPPAGHIAAEQMRGKIVLWGANPSGFKDVVSTPLSAAFSGPEYQLTVIDNLLRGDGVREASSTTNAALLLALCAGLGALAGGARRRWIPLAAAAVAGGALWLAAYRCFAAGLSIDLVTPTLGVLLTYAGGLAYKSLTDGRRNRWLEGTFSQYLAPSVIAAIQKDPSMLALGGRQREISVLFSDVKGFTTISETLTSDQVVRLLNDYLTRQSAPVLENDGVIDKFIGDAVMAFFGDPVAQSDHARRACQAAVASVKAAEGSQALARSLGLAGITNRIGIASGPATVGNIGSDRRFNYTAIGDTVNFASRLESSNKAFGSRILLADATYQAARGAVLAKPLASLLVVGKSEPVPVWELLAMAYDASDALRRHAEVFTRAHAAVLADDLDAAERLLEEAEGLHPGDGPCRWLGALIDELHDGRRPRPWDGVYAMDSK